MKSIKLALFHGFLIWLIVFVAAIAIFPLREPNRPLFESIMPVILTACATIFSVTYLRRLDSQPLREGIWLGLIWFVLNLSLDQLMFSWGPMKMNFSDYLKDIGVTYLLIIIIPTGFGYLLSQRKE